MSEIEIVIDELKWLLKYIHSLMNYELLLFLLTVIFNNITLQHNMRALLFDTIL